MLYKTSGVIINKQKSDYSNIIVDIYTDKFGKQKYIINNLRISKNKISAFNFNLLRIVNITAINYKPHFYHYINDIQSENICNIAESPIKSTIAFFISELLHKSLPSNLPDTNIFSFIVNSIKYLDLCKNETSIKNFPIIFLINLSQYLGLYPKCNYLSCSQTNSTYFDLEEAAFTNTIPNHNNFMDTNTSKALIQFIESSTYNSNIILLDRIIRNRLIQNLLKYYELHNGLLAKVNSHKILEQLLD